MSEFESNVCGIPCIIRVTHYDYYQPAFISGPPENCYPAEGGCGDWEVLDRRGRPAPWLERKLTDRERSRIDDEVFEHMECDDDY
jgi:hypothetical protein